MIKLRFLFLIAFGLFAIFGFAALDRLTMKIEKSLAESAAILNADAPRKIDAYTDFIGARTNGKEITYLFRKYGITPASLTASQEQDRANRIAVMKKDKDTKRLLSLGARMRYEYFVGDELVLQFSISKDELD